MLHSGMSFLVRVNYYNVTTVWCNNVPWNCNISCCFRFQLPREWDFGVQTTTHQGSDSAVMRFSGKSSHGMTDKLSLKFKIEYHVSISNEFYWVIQSNMEIIVTVGLSDNNKPAQKPFIYDAHVYESNISFSALQSIKAANQSSKSIFLSSHVQCRLPDQMLIP